MQGEVKFFDRERHFGFVCLTDGELVFSEFFFHGNDVIGELPRAGDLVSFSLADPPRYARRRELIAVEVERITSSDTVAREAFEKFWADDREEARAYAG